MKQVRALAILNFFFFLLHLVPSQLSQFKVFGELTMGEVSDKYDTAFTPAGIAFAIWGPIYLSLFAFCIYHLIKAFRANPAHEANSDLQRIGYLFMLNNVATGLWTVIFLNELLLLSVLLIFLQLITLVLINIRLGIYKPDRSVASRVFTQFPLTIYFAWICIATIANTSAWLVSEGWNGFGLPGSTWAIIMICIAMALAVFIILNRRNPFFGLVVVWAFYGIILKQQEATTAGAAEVLMAAWIGVGLVAAMLLWQFFRNQRYKTNSPASEFV